MPDQFRTDNTDGYTEAELAELNEAWVKLTAHDHLLGMTEDTRFQYLKHMSETLLRAFDAGKRGRELLWECR